MDAATMQDIDELIHACDENFNSASGDLMKLIETSSGNSIKDGIGEIPAYTIRRLLKGLDSSDRSQQNACYSMLYGLLQFFPTLTPHIFKNIIKKHERKSDVCSTGFVLGCAALVRSDSFFQNERIVETLLDKLLLCWKNETLFNPLLIHIILTFLSQANFKSTNKIKICKFFANGILTKFMEKPTYKAVFCLFHSLQLVLPNVEGIEDIKQILCPFVVQRMVAVSSYKNSALNEVLKGVCVQISLLFSNKFAKQSDFQIETLKCLINAHSDSVRFDKLTGTTLLQDITKHFTKDAIKTLVADLHSICDKECNDKKSKLSMKKSSPVNLLQSAHWISLLMSHPSVSDSEHIRWKAIQVAYLLKLAFFTKIDKDIQTLRNAYLRGFEQPLKELEDQLLFVGNIASSANELLKEQGLNCKLSVEARLMWNRIMKRLDILKSKENINKKDCMVFRLLYSHLSLQLFNDSKNIIESVHDLDQCYEKAFIDKTNKSLKPQEKPDEDLQWMDVMLDLILSLLSKESHFWRKISISIFRNLCHLIEIESLSLITDVYELERENLLTNNEGEMDASGDMENEFDINGQVDNAEEDESDDDESAEEEEDTNSEGDERDSDAESESDDDGQVQEEEEEEEKEEEEEGELSDEAKLRLVNIQKKMAMCLKLNLDDVELDNVPDDEFNNIDKMLGPLIKEYAKVRKGTSRRRSTADETSLMHFRLRVCDLLDTLIEFAPSLNHLLFLISPLLRCLQRIGEQKISDQSQLSTRLESAVIRLMKVKKFKNTEGVSPQMLSDQLDAIIAIGSKSPGNLVLRKLVTALCHYLISLSLNIFDENGNMVFSSYLKHLKAFLFEKEWPMPGDVLARPLSIASGSLNSVANCLVDCAFLKPARLHRRMKALEFLTKILKNNEAMQKMSPSDRKKINKAISNHVPKIFDNATNIKTLKKKLMKCLLDLIKATHILHNRNPDYKNGFDWETMSKSLGDFYQRVDITSLKDLDSCFKNLAKHLKLQLHSHKAKEGKKRKRTSEDCNESNNADTMQSKKKKKKSDPTDKAVLQKRKKYCAEKKERSKTRSLVHSIDTIQDFSFPTNFDCSDEDDELMSD